MRNMLAIVLMQLTIKISFKYPFSKRKIDPLIT